MLPCPASPACRARRPRLLRGDADAFLDALRVVGADLRADAVLQRRDDLAARGVVLRVGGEDDRHIQRQAHRVALNLHIAFLHDVEQRHLDLAGEVGQLVDGEDAAVGARQQAVVHGQLGAQVLVGARRLDGVDIAHQVGHGHVRRGQLFHVAVVRRHPRDRRLVAQLRDQVARKLGDRRVRIVAQLGAGDIRRLRVEQRGQRAQDARLGLPAQAQQDEVVPREHRIHQLRDDRVLVADDPGKQRRHPLARRRAQPGDQVLAQLVLDRAANPGWGEFAGAQCAEGRGEGVCHA